MEFINKTIDGPIAWLKLNRPQVFNSFHRGMAMELLECLESLKSDDEIRCIVLSGEGKAFCAGQDLQEAIDPDGPGLHKIIGEHYNPIIKMIRTISKPVIAAINGVAAGAGANIALACDIVVATQSANFIQAFSKIGLIPDSGGTYHLPRLIGWQKSSGLMMTGEKVSATDAMNMGMIFKVFPDDQFTNECNKLALQLANMPTKALALTKELLNESFTNSLEQQLEAELNIQLQAASTFDYKEGVNAFLEKRKPEFKGN